MSVTGDTANRLGCYSAEVCALYPQESFPPLSLRTAWCLKTGRTKQGLPKSSSGPLPVPIQSYRSSTSRSTVRPESPRCPTKPEPIMTCGCAGKPRVLKYPSISLSLGEAFRKMSWRFSMHPGHPLVSPGCPSTVLHPVVNFEVHLELDVMGLSSS